MIIRKTFAEEFRQLPKGLKITLTYDQGTEMAQHKLSSKETGITAYFSHTHSPWGRKTDKNTNVLMRQYFPKVTDFTIVSRNRIKEIWDKLNDRPRKALSFCTPHEKFVELLR